MENECVVRLFCRTFEEDPAEIGEQQPKEPQLLGDEVVMDQRVGRDDPDLCPILAHTVVHGDPSFIAGGPQSEIYADEHRLLEAEWVVLEGHRRLGHHRNQLDLGQPGRPLSEEQNPVDRLLQIEHRHRQVDAVSELVGVANDRLASIDLNRVRSTGYCFQVEMTYRAICRGARVVESPIVFTDRRAGESKMSAAIFVEAIWRVPLLRFTVKP